MAAVKVSVIMPVYNTERYLPRCLDSIINQTLKEIEIICVDDGSTDGSAEVLDAYEKKDSRIRIYRQPNLHLGIARNNGLKHASGEYIIFWDSDDYFDPCALEKLYKAARKSDADICVCGGYQFADGTDKIMLYDGLLRTKLVPKTQPFNMVTNPGYILNFTNMAVWNKLYRREYLIDNDMAFSAVKRGEDIRFTARALCLADRITVVKDKLVYYRFMRKDGLVAGYAETVKEVLDCWCCAADELKAGNRFPEQSFTNRVLASCLFVLKNIQSWTAFCEACNYLKDSVFPKVGLTERKPGYYYVRWQEELLYHLLKEDPEEFVISLLSVMNRRFMEKTTEKQMREEEYRRKIKAQSEEYDRMKKQLKAREKTIRKQKAMLEELETGYSRLTTSTAYRIGRAATWLPEKVKTALYSTKREKKENSKELT